MERETLGRLVKQEDVEDAFYFEGAVQNVSDYLQHADIGVLCSDREGLPNAILEYIAKRFAGSDNSSWRKHRIGE